MNNKPTKKILLIDDDVEILNLLSKYLDNQGYTISQASSGKEGILTAKNIFPDLIILDILMPEMDGFEVCQKLQQDQNLSYCPVVFLSAYDEPKNRMKAFSLGCVDFLSKPISKEEFIKKINLHLLISEKWKDLKRERRVEEKIYQKKNKTQHPSDDGSSKRKFNSFYRFLIKELRLGQQDEDKLQQVSFLRIYEDLKKFGLNIEKTARLLAKFSQLEYVSPIEATSINLGLLPYSFCKTNLIIPVKKNNTSAFIISNPLDLSLLDSLQKIIGWKESLSLKLSDPESIHHFFDTVHNLDIHYPSQEKKYDSGIFKTSSDRKRGIVSSPKRKIKLISHQETSSSDDKKLSAFVNLTNQVLTSAIYQRASDIHIEPKEDSARIRFRIDGDLHEAYFIPTETSKGLISRLKVLAHMNITETRRPQDGSIEAMLEKKKIKMRLATVGTPYGESMIIRIFDPSVSVISLSNLGMNKQQMELTKDLTSSQGGLILVVGPTGSGKTTTVYSLLNSVDTKSRSLISIEDPVEYSIPNANQQEVNDKIGMTFGNLLKSAVRQDPDILFVGEIRDNYSAKMAIEGASTGHLSLSTLHTLNATTAIFRLERFAISRAALAEALLAIIAQRLVRTLCPHCKEIREILKEDKEHLANFTRDIPRKVGYPTGCHKCNNTGYLGRSGVYEILCFDSYFADLVRRGVSISQIRTKLLEKNAKFLFHHALEKVHQKEISVEEAYSKVLNEENYYDISSKKHMPLLMSEENALLASPSQEGRRILVVEDDDDMITLIRRFLTDQNYEIFSAQDGIDALMQIGKVNFDLILCDINMPNLDGLQLLEILTQKKINIPVIFITSRTAKEDEIRGLSLGAIDYMKKPITKDILLLRIGKILKRTSR